METTLTELMDKLDALCTRLDAIDQTRGSELHSIHIALHSYIHTDLAGIIADLAS